MPEPLERGRRLTLFAVFPDQVACGVDSLGFAQEKDDLDLRAGLELERGLDGGAGVESLARGAGERARSSAAGAIERTMAADELGAIGGDRSGAPVDIGKRQAGGEVRSERVSRRRAPVVGVDLGHDVHGRIVAGRAQDPLGIVRRRQLSRTFARRSGSAAGSA